MFAEVEFEWTVVVQPDAMKSGAHIQRAVILALLKDFNDVKCTARHGYHVVLTTLENIGEGRLWERRGCAAFPVRFRCVVFNVFKNEYVLAVVTEAHSGGVVTQCGPIEQLFISKKHMRDYEFMSAEVDSLEVTKWRHIINETTIKKGDVIRVEILGTKWEPAQRAMSAAGSLMGEYAGVDDRWPELKEPSKTNQQGDGGWGEPATNGDTYEGGWGEPITNGDTSNTRWEESPTNEATANDGWGQPPTNEDHIGTSGWD
ncbi:unnamed protein product [Calypogeia fissa]